MDPADDSSTSDILDLHNDEGWEDVEADNIEETFVSLFDEKSFTDVNDMFRYCKDNYAFDIWQLQRQHDLDFLGLVKIVNYVRQHVKQGNQHPDVSAKSNFDDEMNLMPVLQDDAVLYNLEDILQASTHQVEDQVEDLREQLAKLQSQFTAYREDVQKYLQPDLKAALEDNPSLPPLKASSLLNEEDDHYFRSYSYNSIHESMLKDTVRTDAYRDFMYDNKHIFKDKIVLDVGCGTGILSMFCARAGAKLVIAVDNSDIIGKAKQNIADNHLSDKIKCIRGKIEEVTLPVEKVDVIVSEWMGYCLLFESMLDSVIHARDKYLAQDGLMAPSHVTIELAPLSDSELRVSYIDFWKDVYGFNMTPMLEKAKEEVLVRTVGSKELASESSTVLKLDLHTAQVKDLDFKTSFKLEVKDGYKTLEGFVLWFDTYFMPSRSASLPEPFSVESAKDKGIVAFSTGPATKPTHWQQGVCLIEGPTGNIPSGSVIGGQVTFSKQAGAHRALKIDVTWEVTQDAVTSQTWYLE